jgi:cyclopropane fatty-acyl-phospholipid synthase-like methyltransferase
MNRPITDYIREYQTNKYRDGKKIPIAEFVEDYINGRIDVVGDFREFMHNRAEYFDYSFIPEHYQYFFTQFLPEFFIHSKHQDETIGRTHYNRGNDFFGSFLGDRMIYTSAFFQTLNDTLEEAQDNKLKMVCEKLQLKAGEKLLDIGCGWGTLVRYAAQTYGADATGVTVAGEGAAYAQKQIEEAGITDRARILVCDYRDIPQQKYNKISCLEMAEHVGILRFQKFMKQVYNMLEDDGLFYLQIAGLKHGIHKESMVWGLFMAKYIFPGADASTPLSFFVTNLEQAGFEVHSVENVGIHYSHTIRLWYDNWMKNETYVREHYGQWWFRLWQVFLSWSVDIAAQGNSTCWQIVSHKNLEHFDRNRFIGGFNLGERDFNTDHSQTNNGMTASAKKPVKVKVEDN